MKDDVISRQARKVFEEMSDAEFEKWLYEHGICNPDIHESIPCSVVPLLIDNAINELSAQPERENQKTALSVQVKVDFDDMKALLEDIGNLQTYKLSEGDDMVLADIEGIKGILAKHVKAKEVQPEQKNGRWIPHHEENPLDGSRGGVTCSNCGWKTHNKMHFLMGCSYKFCPNCGYRMESDGNETD